MKDYNFGSGRAPLAAFASTPYDARSACIAILDGAPNPEGAVVAAWPLGAPVVFACHGNSLEWWKQTRTQGKPELLERIPSSHIARFFDGHRGDFSPDNIFEGKTLRRLPGQRQLEFVDAGLMPFVEQSEGERLCHCLEMAFRDIEAALGRKLGSHNDAQNAIKATFWLLAAKTLHDKEVNNFRSVDLSNINDVFTRVGRHYGVPDGVPPKGKAWRAATTAAAKRLGDVGNLRNLSTESLAHVYENTMVTQEVRTANGTHCTPGPLVDYIVWQLWPWIEELPRDRRHVFEPACGHGAFLLGALRVLRQWSNTDDGKASHDYLKKHLHGVELDPFALEVARLSLTLADIPHGNTWDLMQSDMFVGTTLEDGAEKCGVLLANPPFERFTRKEKAKYKAVGVAPVANTKACEMLRHTIPHLTEGACFGVVVPQGLLHSKEGTSLRQTILSDFELSEIDVFDAKMFEKGEHETAVLMGRRKRCKASSRFLWFRRVRNAGRKGFLDRFAFSSEERVQDSRFAATELADLRVPELDGVWKYLTAYPVLGSIATAAKGLDYKGKTLPSGCWTVHNPAEPGDPQGYANVNDDLDIFGAPKVVGINLEPVAVMSYRAGRTFGKPQVLLNYARVSRGVWRLKATIDPMGLAITSSFAAVRPTQPDVSVWYVWAILNSPVANAFAYCHLGKRHVLVGTMRKMPVPHWSSSHSAHIEQAAIRYQELATSTGPLFDLEATPEGICRALREMDAAVLQAYDLPPRLERQLLDLFTGVPRKGVGCEFTGYYPPGFSSYLPLHMLLSEGFQRAAADVTCDRFKPGESEHVRRALAAATADADEE